MKKTISLLLALVLSLSLFGCGAKSEPAPDPGATLEALLLTLFHEDATGMGQLFGYTTYNAVVEDWLDGEDPRDLMLNEFVNGFAETALQEGIVVDDAAVQKLGDAVTDAVARVPFTCTTDVIDEDAGTAVVSVSVNPFPEDCLGNAMLNYVYANHLDALLAAGDDPADIYAVIFDAVTQYVEQLQPVSEAVSFTVPCKLTDSVINGKTRTCWTPADAEDLGEQFIFAMFDMN